MESKNKILSSFIDGLKSSNIESNITSLNVYSEQIEMLLKQINDISHSQILKYNIKKCIEAITKTYDDNLDADNLINKYIKFGDIFKSSLTDLKKSVNIKILKDIAINYLSIAKYTKDTRIKNIAVAIAEELSK